MKKVLINIPQELLDNIDAAIKTWGFASRSEFFRFTAIDFLHDKSELIPSNEVLEKHTQAIRVVKNRQESAKLERDWIRKNRYTHVDER